jgi:hypothetical protein
MGGFYGAYVAPAQTSIVVIADEHHDQRNLLNRSP